MVKYKIEFDRELCIGAFACTAVAPEFWPMSEDGKVDLNNATYNEETKKWELMIDEKDYEVMKESVEVCPVEAIILTKIEDGQSQNEVDNKQDSEPNVETNQDSENKNISED